MEKMFWMLVGAVALMVLEVVACIWSQYRHDQIMRRIEKDYWHE